MKQLFFMIALLFAIGLNAQENGLRQNHYNLDKTELALQGYDPVSYFTAKKPLKGDEKWTYIYKGVHYRFSSEANKAEFAKNPANYEPAYGGWCAYAMAENGEKVKVDPLSYKISHGRLLLFYKAPFANTLAFWNKDKTPEADRLKKADNYWKNILNR
jgi:YHS domain-containing protein